jgi:ATP-dependent Clp protease ATP-binding subunit ClpB
MQGSNRGQTVRAQGLAGQLGHQQIEPEHLLKVMLEQSEGIARSVLQKLGASPEGVLREVADVLEKRPKVSGAGGTGEVHISPATKKVLDGAFAEAANMKDEYVRTYAARSESPILTQKRNIRRCKGSVVI